jgi:hypothetical protein
MNLFGDKNKSKKQNKGKKLLIITRCDKCIRYNITCPYGNQPTRMSNNGRRFEQSEVCDAYTDSNNAKYQGHSKLVCPHCGSHEIKSQLDRFICNTCGAIFS